MSDTIYYGYGQNLATLDALKTTVHDAEILREDVRQVFTALAGIYQGQAADALQIAHTQISQQMDQIHSDTLALLQQAVDRQYITQAQDHQLSQGF